jgi:Glycosyl hydrolase family 71
MKLFVYFLFLVLPGALLGQTTSLQALTANNTSAVRQISGAELGNISKLPIRSLLYPGATTKILVHYMGWFGSAKHKDVGYRSDDPNQVKRQVEDMISRGIDGVIVDWYGPDDQLIDRSAKLMFAEAERHPGFSAAISIDTGAFRQCDKQHCDVTDEMVQLLRYVERNFESSPAYLRVNGRPLVTSFGLEQRPIDWNVVRASARGNPLFIFRNAGGFQRAQSDGAFSWAGPAKINPSDPTGSAYLNAFNAAAMSAPGKISIGSAYKGFDDSDASWGKGKLIPENCGRTWLETFDLINRTYSTRRQLPFLQIPTWNDYEEGTEIESGIDNCVSLRVEMHGSKLQWKLQSGSRDTIDHYTVWASSDGKRLTPVGDADAGADSFDLKKVRVPAGTRQLYLQAVGKASIRNHLVGPIGYGSGDD